MSAPPDKGLSFRQRLGFALAGLRDTWRSEKSFRTQCVLALVALGVMLWLRPALFWWGLGGSMVVLLLVAELANTALEQLVDHLHPERHEAIRRVKDTAAAAVLVLGLGCLGVAALIVVDALR